MAQYKHLLVLGGTGHLGRAIVTAFNSSWKVTSLAHSSNDEAHNNITLSKEAKISTQLIGIYDQIDKITKHYNGIFCVAGGWNRGTIKDNDVLDKFDLMNCQNVYSSLLAGHLATKYLANTGLLVLTGAAAVFKDVTPDMIAYTITKSTVHSLALNLSQREELSPASTVVTILPDKLDTPENRESAPKADFSKWTPPDKIAGLLKMWAEGENLPENGSFASLKMVKGAVITEFL